MEEKYVKYDNGDYKVDISKVGPIERTFSLIAMICMILIPLLLIEQIWLDYLPTAKLLISCLVIGFPCFKLAQLSLYDYEETGFFDGKYVLREEYRKLKEDE